jgi:hypothetical protein
MSTARILIKQGSQIFRFLRFEASTDGSLILFLDRDARSKRGSMDTNEDGVLVPNGNVSDRALPSGRFSIHTTGVIHRYAAGERKATIHIEPLHALTKVTLIGFVSFPRISRLDPFDETNDRCDTAATLEIPEDVFERITFAIEIGPKPQQPATFGVALNYELYSAIVRLAPNPSLPPELSEHFIHGMLTEGRFDERQIDKANAELAFYQRIHGRSVFIFREDRGGAYVIMAVVPMARTPKLNIGFDRNDLRIEVIPFEKHREPTHKVRFWICDKGGRNKKDDLRKHVTSVELNAEL